jgi:hypothetical protein
MSEHPPSDSEPGAEGSRQDDTAEHTSVDLSKHAAGATAETPVEAEAPPPPSEPGDPAVADAPPPRRPGRSRLVAIIAAAVVVVLVAAGVSYLVLRPTHHKITTPATAGSMKRDKAKEKSLASELTLAKQQFKTQGKGECASVKYVKAAVYDQSSAKRGPKGDLVFLGAKLSKEQEPSKWTACFSKLVATNGLKTKKVDAGDGDAKGVCASITTPQKVTVCGWATKDTVGEIVPTVPGYDAKLLSKIMVDLRADVEQSE